MYSFFFVMTNHYLNKVPVLTEIHICAFCLKCGNLRLCTDESAGVFFFDSYLCDLDR